jgi:transcriptional regulator with XRE-family HTH domain
MVEKREASEFSKAVGNVIFGRYKGKRWNQDRLSEKIGVKPGTLRRMIAGETEIGARQLQLIATVLDTTAQSILDEALSEYGGLDRLVADAVAEGMSGASGKTNVTQLHPRDATTDQLEQFAGAADKFTPEASEPDEE